jgi:hypothetical protein
MIFILIQDTILIMRCFYGDITGHFWVGGQDAFDELGAREEPFTLFHGCGCTCIVNEHDMETLYCTRCYTSYKDHMDDAPKSVNGLAWFVDHDRVVYRFEHSDIDTVKTLVDDLFTPIGEYTESFVLIEEEHTIQYDFRLPDGLESEDIYQLAIWCMGKLVLRSLEKYGKCYVTCESITSC